MRFQRWMLRIGAALLAVIVVAGITTALPGDVEAAGMLVADGRFGGDVEIQRHDVTVTINNGVAVTKVEQVFHNKENRRVEALYTFPVPKGASVSNFSMMIDGKEMVGEVLEEKRAREIYNSYKQQNKDPGLLEQVSYKRFEMRVFPIPAGDTQQISLTYYQELDVDQNWATYTYPLATVTEEGLSSQTQGSFSFQLETKSAIPIVSMESSSHPDAMAMTQHTKHYREASFETRSGNLNKDIVVEYKLSRPVSGVDMVTSNTRRGAGYFLMTLTVGQDLKKHRKGMDYVFVLDRSGSMDNQRKFILSRNAVNEFLGALSPKDRFDVITFNDRPYTLFDQLRSAGDSTIRRAERFVEDQRAQGGTRLLPALRTAYEYQSKNRQLNVVILSDGMTDQGRRRRLIESIRNRPSNTRVFAVGVGNEVNRPLLRRMTRKAGGLANFVSSQSDFDRLAKSFRRKLSHPVATDLKVAVDGVEVFGKEPRDLPNLYHGSPVRLYGRYKGSGKATVTFKGTVNGRTLEKSTTLSFPKTDKSNPEIERMWAWHRVDRLINKVKTGRGDREQLVDEIVRLGEGYSIVTPYTSFLVLESKAEYKRWEIERRNARRIKRDRRAQKRRREMLRDMRAQAIENLGPSAGDQPGSKSSDSSRSADPTNGSSSTRTPSRQRTADRSTAQTNPTRSSSSNSSQTSDPRQRSSDQSSNVDWSGGGAGPVGPVLFGLIYALYRRFRAT